MTPRYLSARDVRRALAAVDPVEVVTEALRLHALGDTTLPRQAHLRWSANGASARSLGMPAYVGGRFAAAGMKVINASSGNTGRGAPRASGVILLFDSSTARITHILEAADISALRTAAVTCAAVRLLARRPVRRLCIVGAGPIGAAHLALLSRELDAELEVACIADRDHGRAAALAATNSRAFATDTRRAVRGADLVVTATTATKPYIPMHWLARGSVVANVSLDDLLPEVLLGCDRLYVDDWDAVAADEHRLLGRLARAGRVEGPRGHGAGSAARRVDGELGELIASARSGRRSPEDIVVVNPFGLAVEDVALGSAVCAVASASDEKPEAATAGSFGPVGS